MFSGEKVLVDLRCDNSLMKTMVDRFGEDVTTLAYDMTSFRVQTEVSASPTSVSYTHLDVYKRQHMYWMVFIPRIDTNDSIIYSKDF